MNTLWCDFETRSRCDLPGRGVYNYMQDASTEVLCMSYAFDDEDVQTWTPDQPFPQKVSDAILSGVQIRAHNAAFERLLFWYVICPDFKVPEPALEQFYCTAAQARANCAPGSLEDVGRFAGASMKKDHRGAALIRALSVPQADGRFREDADLMAEMIRYCEQDVLAMRAFSQAMRDLTDEELADYHINERINDRGLLIDVPLCRAAMKYATREVTETEAEVLTLTDGEVTSVRSPRLREWVWRNVGGEAHKLMQAYKDGEARKSLDKNARAALVGFAEENPDEVPAQVAAVIKAADNMFSSSVAKYARMADLADEADCRLRGAFVFAGGSATGRNSSVGAQLQNMSRKCAKEPEPIREAIVRGHEIVPKYGERVTDVLKSMLRPAIKAPNGRLIISYDWVGIEARMTPWCSGDPAAEATLNVFREGRDIYVSTAAAMFGKPEDQVTKEERTLGKVAVLACGFGGGVGAFASMGRIYGVVMPESDAKRTVDLWRKANPWARKFWQSLETAALRAVRNPGDIFTAGRIAYVYQGKHLWYRLPSGRVLCYPYVRFDEDGGLSYAKAAWKPSADAKEWPRARLWFGVQIENAVQASANCLLRHALRNLNAAGIEVIGSIHDEIIVECDACVADDVGLRMQKIMTAAPDWCTDLPLAVEGAVTERFSK
jgi:DNA polymerase